MRDEQHTPVDARGAHRHTLPQGGFVLDGIWKQFGTLQVLKGVSVAAGAGEVHALVGENGAGKTTLVRILAGLEHADSGSIEVGGRQLSARPLPREAQEAGVGLVPQHCEVVPGLSVLENLALGWEPSRLGVLRKQETRTSADELARRLGFSFGWNAPAETLGLSQRQRLELLRVLWRNSAVLVFDEPTTVLTAGEVDGLFDVLRSLAAEGRTVVLITHKLEEVRQIADAVTVLRGGTVVGRVDRAEVDLREIARLMVGDLVAPPAREGPARPGKPRLRIRGIETRATGEGDRPLHGIDLELRGREIVGIAGVEGNGQSELCDIVLGLRAASAGTVELEGRPVEDLSVAKRRARGIASIPADRMTDGVNRDAGLWENVAATAVAVGGNSRLGTIRRRALRERSRRVLAKMGVRADLDLPARALSGGNIQRLVVGRELEDQPRVLVAAHPTRGVDVRGMAFIHEKLLELRAAGCAVLVVSADLDELSQLADRVVVMFDGRIVGGYVPGELDAAEIGMLMTGAAVGAA
ncbi:MAG: ABC transporter ATP-binding protein [Gaiellaceae bacterium]